MLRASVIVFPGSNCDRDVKTALEAITGFPVKMVWHGDASVPLASLISVANSPVSRRRISSLGSRTFAVRSKFRGS